jgi:DNA repair exonuclease SbcCD ATPase subunit
MQAKGKHLRFPRCHTLVPIPLVALMALLGPSLPAPAQVQGSAGDIESVVEAARIARERKANSKSRQPKIITNADLHAEQSLPSTSAFHLQPASTLGEQVSIPGSTGCDNPEAVELRIELEAIQRQLDGVRRELSFQAPVISDNDLDLQYFKPGYSGFNVGSPPLLDAEPPVPLRLTEVELEEQVTALKKSLHLACESPEAATIQRKLDVDEQKLDLLQREFALDQDAYYSNPDYARQSARKAQLDAELQDINSLRREIERLKDELTALQSSPDQ